MLAECPNGHDTRLTTRMLNGAAYCYACRATTRKESMKGKPRSEAQIEGSKKWSAAGHAARVAGDNAKRARQRRMADYPTSTQNQPVFATPQFQPQHQPQPQEKEA